MSADAIKIRCPHCAGKIAAEDDYYQELVGTAISCPHCGREILVPAIGQPGEQPPSGDHSVDVTREIQGVADPEPEVILPTPDETRHCPQCGANIGLRDRICIGCGCRIPLQDG